MCKSSAFSLFTTKMNYILLFVSFSLLVEEYKTFRTSVRIYFDLTDSRSLYEIKTCKIFNLYKKRMEE